MNYKFDKYYEKTVEDLIKYGKNSDRVTKMVVFGNALLSKPDNYEYGPDDELSVAVYIDNPKSEDEIKSIYKDIGYKIKNVYPCMVDYDIYTDELYDVIAKGVVIYGH